MTVSCMKKCAEDVQNNDCTVNRRCFQHMCKFMKMIFSQKRSIHSILNTNVESIYIYRGLTLNLETSLTQLFLILYHNETQEPKYSIYTYILVEDSGFPKAGPLELKIECFAQFSKIYLGESDSQHLYTSTTKDFRREISTN